MRVSVFGLGYVGCITAACLADKNHQVIGVDVDRQKINRLNRGASTVLEPGLPEIVSRAVKKKRLRATGEVAEAIEQSDVSLICVGTPLLSNGSIDLSHLESVAADIGSALSRKHERHLVVVRSTAIPGTAEQLTIPALEKHTSRRLGKDFAVCVNPEFMREGTSVRDFHNPPFTLIGESERGAGETLKKLYWFLRAPVIQTSLRVAETVKIVGNVFHGLKVGFANEIGNICQAVGVDSHEVMKLVCRDHVLNISPKYLMPGFAFGGSCIPKDLQALLYQARQHDVETPIVRAILPSNDLQVLKAMEMIRVSGRKQIGLVGLAFKEGSDDLRQSPMVRLAEMLLGKGYKVQIYDRYVRLSRIRGANRRYIEREIPHLSKLMARSPSHVFRSCEVVVLGQNNPEWRKRASSLLAGKIVIDLVGVRTVENLSCSYRGISW